MKASAGLNPSVAEIFMLLRQGQEMDIQLCTNRYGPNAPLPRWNRRLRFWTSLLRLDFPGTNALARLMIQRILPMGRSLHVSPGFNCLLGRIYSESSSLCDGVFIDYGNIYIGRGSGFSFQCLIITSNHDLADLRIVDASDIVIGENVWICSRATILPGVHIGRNSVVGAGSMVTHDIPPNVFAAGVPARPIREVDRSNPQNLHHPNR